MIHVIGDSHTNVFCDRSLIPPLYPNFHVNKNFRVWRIGAPLAYSLGKYNSYYEGRKKLEFILKTEITRNDSVILSFGEIDCRYHILKQSQKQNKSTDQLVVECVDKYLEALNDIFNKDTFYWVSKVGVLGPVASTWVDEKYSNRDMPICGNMIERNKLTKYFNDVLNDKVKDKFNFLTYISIFDKLINENYSTKREMYRDNIHLNANAIPYITFQLKEKGFI